MLRYLSLSDEEKESMSINSRRLAEERFDIKYVKSCYERILQDMILDSDKRRKERSHVKASLKGGFFCFRKHYIMFLTAFVLQKTK